MEIRKLAYKDPVYAIHCNPPLLLQGISGILSTGDTLYHFSIILSTNPEIFDPAPELPNLQNSTLHCNSPEFRCLQVILFIIFQLFSLLFLGFFRTMPPVQLIVPRIKGLLGGLPNAEYNTARETMYRLIVSIGMYHLWYYDSNSRTVIWSLIFRIMHNILPAVVPIPGPGVVVPPDILMGVFHLFISCQKHILSTKRAMWDACRSEYDRCAVAGFDTYTCHHRGVYAGNLQWHITMRGIPMRMPLPDFPTLTLPAPYGPRLVGVNTRRERGPPSQPPAPLPVVPLPSFLPSTWAHWVAAHGGPPFTGNFLLPPGTWTVAAAAAAVANMAAVLAAMPVPGSLNKIS